MPTDSKRVQALFLRAIDQAQDARPAFLDQECGADAELRQRVEALLKAHADPGSFLNSPEWPATSSRETSDYVPTEQVGAVIAGRYKLLQQIGEGGMGSVFMAEQLQPVKRMVAFKAVKAGMDSKQVLARFESERQALALMDHPNIAKVLDAGTTEHGRPFFVMELVKGVALTKFCDDRQVSVGERLKIFQQVCHAIQHAHQKGIIHRDLKPSNILVESHDGRPVPKIIDFGLAKAMHSLPLTERSLFTHFGAALGTPLYMAPEQAELSAIDIDTRADIYALGVILYELLTGTTPLERKRFDKAAWDEIRRLIKEEEPPKPSVRLSTSDALPSIAARRQTEPHKLGKFIRGDLDWIVMKALAKERDHRYETANAFAADVERFLNHEPVSAGPPTVAYKLRKFVRRNKGPVVVATLLSLSLLGGIIGTTWGMIRANEAKAIATGESEEKDKALASAAAEKVRAQEQAKLAYRFQYKADMRLAQQYDDVGLAVDVLRILDFHRPIPGREDRRGFEYYRAWFRYRRDLATLPGHESDARTLAVSAKAGLVASGGTDRVIRLWDIATRALVASLTGHQDVVTTLAFYPDGKSLLSGGADGLIIRWDIAGRKRLETHKGHEAEVTEVAIAPRGDFFASTSLDGTLRLWGEGKAKQLTEPFKPYSKFYSLSFSLNGNELAAACEILGGGRTSYVVTLWNANNGEYLHQWLFPGARIDRVRYSPDGQLLAAASRDGFVDLWKPDERGKAGKTTPIKLHENNVISSMAFSADGRLLLTGSWDQTIKLFDLQAKKLLHTFFGHTGWIRDVAFLPGDKTFVSAAADGTLKFWLLFPEPESLGLNLRAPDNDSTPFEVLPTAMTLDAVGNQMAACSKVGTVRLFDLRNGHTVSTFRCHPLAVLTVAFFPDGQRLATGSFDKKIKIWQLPEGKLLDTLEGHTGDVRMAAVSPDGRILATGSDDQTVKIWDVMTHKVRTTFAFPHPGNQFIQCGAFSPDGNRFAAAVSGAPGLIKVWDLENQKELVSYEGHASSGVYKLAFSPDGGELASASGDQTAKLWDSTTGRPIRTIKGHTGVVSALAFSPDGRRIATGSYDGTVKLWDEDGEMVAMLTRGPPAWAVQFSADGQTLLIGLDRGQVAFLRASSAETVARTSRSR